MNNDRFDDDVRKVFESFEEDYDKSSWEQLSTYMDEHPESLMSIEEDKAYQQKLSKHREALKDEHWEELKSELDFIDEKKEQLWLVKGLEIVVVLLLLFTIDNYRPLTRPLDSKNTILEYAQMDKIENSPEQLLIAPLPLRYNSEVVSTVTYDANARNVVKNIIERNAPDRSNASNRSAEHTEHSSDNLSWSQVVSPDKPSRAEVAVPMIASLEIIGMAVRDVEITIAPAVMANDMADESSKPVKYSLEFPFSRDINFINSSLGYVPLRSRLGQGISGLSFGAMIAYHIAPNMSLSTGLMYGEKTHTPGRLKSIAKASQSTYLETQLDYIEFRQIEIPLRLHIGRHSMAASGFYGIAGVGLNVITDYDFGIRKQVQPSARISSFDVSNAIDLRELPSGVVQAGAIQDNIYATSIIGLGYQVILPNDAALFFQPQYQFMIGKGANDYIRRVNSFNMEAGVRFMFR